MFLMFYYHFPQGSFELQVRQDDQQISFTAEQVLLCQDKTIQARHKSHGKQCEWHLCDVIFRGLHILLYSSLIFYLKQRYENTGLSSKIVVICTYIFSRLIVPLQPSSSSLIFLSFV